MRKCRQITGSPDCPREAQAEAEANVEADEFEIRARQGFDGRRSGLAKTSSDS